VKRLGNFGFFPHLEIGRLEGTPAEILDKLDKAPLHEKLKQIKAVPKGELDTLLPNGNTLLHQAVIRRDLTFAEALLEAGAKVDSKSESGRTPLSLATASRNQGMILLLVRYGVELRSVDEAFRPILLLYALNKAEPRMLEDLLKAGMRLDQPEHDFAVRRLIFGCRQDILEIFVKHGFSIPDYCARGFTPLIDAIPAEPNQFGDAQSDLLRFLLEQGAPVNQVNTTTGHSALTWSAEVNCVDAVEWLIHVGRADVDAQFEGRPILSHILENVDELTEHIEITQLLMHADAAATKEERTRLCDLLKKPVVPRQLG
jgi:ankyrin repeat protein